MFRFLPLKSNNYFVVSLKVVTFSDSACFNANISSTRDSIVKNAFVYGYKKLTKRIPYTLIRRILTFNLVEFVLTSLGIIIKIAVAIVLFLLI